jgi:hypothetical protein
MHAAVRTNCYAALVARPGGVLLVCVEVAPNSRNYPSVSFGVFDANERKALRAALEGCRLKRQKMNERAKGQPGRSVVPHQTKRS